MLTEQYQHIMSLALTDPEFAQTIMPRSAQHVEEDEEARIEAEEEAKGIADGVADAVRIRKLGDEAAASVKDAGGDEAAQENAKIAAIGRAQTEQTERLIAKVHELRAASAKREEARRVSDGGARAAESEESDDDMQAPRLVGRSALSPRVSVDKQSAPAQPVPAHQDDVKPALVYRRGMSVRDIGRALQPVPAQQPAPVQSGAAQKLHEQNAQQLAQLRSRRNTQDSDSDIDVRDLLR